MSISRFKPWSGAVYAHNKIIDNNLEDEFDCLIDDLYPDGLTDTDLNDILWFDSEWVFEALGISDDDDDDDDD